jgi:hypothetical protein
LDASRSIGRKSDLALKSAHCLQIKGISYGVHIKRKLVNGSLAVFLRCKKPQQIEAL